MNRPLSRFFVCLTLWSGLALHGQTQRLMENLTRGVVAVKQPEGHVYVGWRLFGTDPQTLAFNLYRVTNGGTPVKVNDMPVTGATNLLDSECDPNQSLQYFVCPVLEGQELAASKAVRAWDTSYLEIPIQPISDYRPGDASVADLDGDGQYEIILHQMSRGRDNSFAGITGTPVFDAYKMDGTHLWRINLGINIRDGEHYTQFMVYDLDGDGKAEMACKTADGTVDGTGQIVGDKDKDWRIHKEGDKTHGRILSGPEYFTILMGKPVLP
jgi:rhamnogalacturonan endolyase